MQLVTPRPAFGIAPGVPHVVGFLLSADDDLTDPADPPVPLLVLPSGCLVTDSYVDLIEPWADSGGSTPIVLALTFGTSGQAFRTFRIDAGTGAIGGARPLVVGRGGGSHVLDVGATLLAGSTSPGALPYSAGVLALWIAFTELNG